MILRKAILITSFLFVCCVVSAQNNFTWLDVSPNNNFEGYEVLDEELKDVEIVLLGEGLHNYPVDTYSKLKIIKYLHTKLNYNIILFEYSFQDFWILNSEMDKNYYTTNDVLYYYLNRFISEGIYSMLSFADSAKHAKDNIIIGGIDIWVGYSNMANHFLNFIPKHDSLWGKNESLKQTYKYLLGLWRNDSLEYNNEMNYLDSMTVNKLFFSDSLLNEIWLQMYINFKATLYYDSYYQNIKHPILSSENRKTYISQQDDFRYRDSIMALNVDFYKKLYPNEKIIIFASSYHVRKSTEPFQKKEIIGNNTVPLGERLSNKYKTYHIAWIYPKLFDKRLKRRKRKSLEYYLLKNEIGSCFIPLNNFYVNDDSNFIAYPIWNYKTKGVWEKAYNAFIYYDTICTYKGWDHNYEPPDKIEWKSYFE